MSPGWALAKIRADIERLETAPASAADTGIRKLIEAWIEEQKQKLASAKNPKRLL